VTVDRACSLLASPSAHPPQIATSGRQCRRATAVAGRGSPQHPQVTIAASAVSVIPRLSFPVDHTEATAIAHVVPR
jgi:hypothetical protein